MHILSLKKLPMIIQFKLIAVFIIYLYFLQLSTVFCYPDQRDCLTIVCRQYLVDSYINEFGKLQRHKDQDSDIYNDYQSIINSQFDDFDVTYPKKGSSNDYEPDHESLHPVNQYNPDFLENNNHSAATNNSQKIHEAVKYYEVLDNVFLLEINIFESLKKDPKDKDYDGLEDILIHANNIPNFNEMDLQYLEKLKVFNNLLKYNYSDKAYYLHKINELFYRQDLNLEQYDKKFFIILSGLSMHIKDYIVDFITDDDGKEFEIELIKQYIYNYFYYFGYQSSSNFDVQCLLDQFLLKCTIAQIL